MIIEVDNISFSFGATAPLFRSFSFEVQRSGIFTLLGFSGTGKTTLLKIIGGLLEPTSGHRHVRSGSRVGYVPQESSLLPWLTVADNICLGHALLGGNDTCAGLRKELVQSFALTEALGMRPRALSGGMKQRAAVISALTSGADILLLDEPFAGSDRVRRDAMLGAVRRFTEGSSDKVAIVTTHDPSDVFALNATAIWLDTDVRKPTVMAPAHQEWSLQGRKKLVELMIGEPV